MKNSTLLFRSLAVLIFIAGIAHLGTYAAQKNDLTDTNRESMDMDWKPHLSKANDDEAKTQPNPETDFIVGKWKVTYNSEDFKGAIVYDIKKEGTVFHAYTYQYQDENGYPEKADGNIALIIRTFDGHKGKGVYTIVYEQEQYQVDCQIDVLDENTFNVSYDYYGYGDVETWKRQ